jgi:DNA-binding MarR family transcriptional regulator
LERKGWLVRELHPTDSRAKIITLTEQGIEIARVAIPVVEQIDQDFFARQPLSQHEFNHALQQLILQGE